MTAALAIAAAVFGFVQPESRVRGSEPAAWTCSEARAVSSPGTHREIMCRYGGNAVDLIEEFDEETGLTYFGARYYDSKRARWISPDPMISSFGVIRSTLRVTCWNRLPTETFHSFCSRGRSRAKKLRIAF